MKRNVKNTILAVTASLILLALIAAALLFFGVIHINNPDSDDYPVAGVDVSCYQGDIDWETLASQNIEFAFIKATEGSSFVDPNFSYNWTEAQKTGLRIGAYHFFSFESSGETQADSFISTVKAVDNMLPPVIDVEYYNDFKTKKDIDVDVIKTELRKLTDKLNENYGIKPVIYCDEKTYTDIVNGDFSDCDLWYRSVYSSVPSDVNWTFWQYSNRHLLKGYKGEERYIDMNVFSGNKDDFALYH